MRKKDSTVRYTGVEIEEALRRGEDHTDWEKLRATTDDDLQRLTKGDADEEGPWSGDWEPGIPAPKRHLNLRIDADVVDWFKAKGPRYQTRMNAVLRAYMEAERRRRG
jgi:uncharacterized protein (DUF4415 family)